MRCSVAMSPRFFKWVMRRESGPYALLFLQLLILLVTWSQVNDSDYSRDIRFTSFDTRRVRLDEECFPRLLMKETWLKGSKQVCGMTKGLLRHKETGWWNRDVAKKEVYTAVLAAQKSSYKNSLLLLSTHSHDPC